MIAVDTYMKIGQNSLLASCLIIGGYYKDCCRYDHYNNEVLKIAEDDFGFGGFGFGGYCDTINKQDDYDIPFYESNSWNVFFCNKCNKVWQTYYERRLKWEYILDFPSGQTRKRCPNCFKRKLKKVKVEGNTIQYLDEYRAFRKKYHDYDYEI